MPLNDTDVRKIAHLARLALPDHALADYGERLSGILDMVTQLSAVPTRDVAPMSHPLDGTQRLRDDAVTEHDRREALQRVAPAVEEGLYLVPRVIE